MTLTGLADHADVGERIYLRGNFLVSTSADTSAVLRPQAGANGKRIPGVRVIVLYPATVSPPQEGATVSRDDTSGFLIEKVRKGEDGVLNITARDLLKGE